jgi:two-component system response regulator AtoC
MKQLPTNSVLIVDDEANMLDMLSAFLRREGYEVTTAVDGRQGLEYASAQPFDFILCDLKMPVMDGLRFLEEAKARKIETTIIMMSAFATVDTAVTAMKQGAYDFVTKPFKIDEVLCILDKAAERLLLKKENRRLRHKIEELEKGRGFADIIGESRALLDILELAGRVAAHDTTVLITGESGTGKELVARGIHRASRRNGGPFVSINCGAIPANLLESEFFGYMKGAFTGADSDHIGLFEAADGGTLLLDEIGELPLELQVKLLRVLQEREIRPVGANINRKINVRIIAATAKNLAEEAERGDFRRDLLFRLNVIELKLPPLRERPDDIPLLVHAFVAENRKKMNRELRGITGEALSLLANYSWPGNIRELKNVIEYATIYAEKGWIRAECLPEHLRRAGFGGAKGNLFTTFSIKEGKALLEKHLIQKALMKTAGNKTRAAELLEISYPSLLWKIKEYNIDPAQLDIKLF